MPIYQLFWPPWPHPFPVILLISVLRSLWREGEGCGGSGGGCGGGQFCFTLEFYFFRVFFCNSFFAKPLDICFTVRGPVLSIFFFFFYFSCGRITQHLSSPLKTKMVRPPVLSIKKSVFSARLRSFIDQAYLFYLLLHFSPILIRTAHCDLKNNSIRH